MTTHYEKRGTANWVQCARCTGWFPVSANLLTRADIALHCPHCHQEFLPVDAACVVAGAGNSFRHYGEPHD